MSKEIDIIEEFNEFIHHWCGKYSPHLLDDDDNAGEDFRNKLREISQ